jgi:hypothetical protein
MLEKVVVAYFKELPGYSLEESEEQNKNSRQGGRCPCRDSKQAPPEYESTVLHSGGWSPNWVHSARRPLTGLLYLPRVIVRMGNLVE